MKRFVGLTLAVLRSAIYLRRVGLQCCYVMIMLFCGDDFGAKTRSLRAKVAFAMMLARTTVEQPGPRPKLREEQCQEQCDCGERALEKEIPDPIRSWRRFGREVPGSDSEIELFGLKKRRVGGPASF